jgi:tetratricopeptide (TPR) repeat protein
VIAFVEAMGKVNFMTFWSGFNCSAVLLTAALLAGCGPGSQSQLDEEKEPHFLAGKSRVNSLDYQGAIESFEKALTANPYSALAHFELACLFETREPDPAAAIYHYQKYLALKPKAENAGIVGQHIMSCKQDLARTVSLGPISEKQQRELERLLEENKRLTDENRRLGQELAQVKTLPPNRPVPQTNAVPSPGPTRSPGTASAFAVDSTRATRAQPDDASNRSLVGTIPTGRAHTVKPGETPTMIARRYGIRLEALLAANPKLEPRRLKVGQTLAIPGSDRGVTTAALTAKSF